MSRGPREATSGVRAAGGRLSGTNLPLLGRVLPAGGRMPVSTANLLFYSNLVMGKIGLGLEVLIIHGLHARPTLNHLNDSSPRPIQIIVLHDFF